MLLFNTTVVYADISGTLPTPLPTIPPLPPDPAEFLIRLCLPDGGAAIDYISDWLKKRWSTDEDKSKDMSSDGNTVTFNSNFVNEFNAALQDKVHALDGYYLVEPLNRNSPDAIASHFSWSKESENYKKLVSIYDSAALVSTYNTYLWGMQYVMFQDFYYYLYLDGGKYYCRSYDPSSSGKPITIPAKPNSLGTWLEPSSSGIVIDKIGFSPVPYYSSSSSIERILSQMASFSYGHPFKVFYSKQAVENYINKGRTYIPKLPSGGFKVNIKYINNTTNLPDITYNITTENKTETEIQNQYDTTINNYLNNLDDFSDGGGGTTTPTPTPSGGSSGGDFGDGTTPTPKPDFTDGSLTDTNTLLQKILDKLTEFSTNHDKLAKTITDYIEKNDGKLEEILIAIQALSDGKTETEQNGCKYDFKALSKYLTDLWNNSDKKFDEMVKLLEENNKYQQKLVDSLNEIKALLIADTVMDFFKDRSQETAEKAKDKFPTSIPWDISFVLNSMSAEPKNPKFSLPIKIESFKINETIDIDLSTDDWEKLAKTCRYILSVTFILFLIHLSRKLFSNGGDD